MKKLFTLIISAIVINYSASGQAVPNGGFETWTAYTNFEEPDSSLWRTLNPLTSGFQFYTCTKSTDVHGGTYSVRLESKYTGPGLNINIPAMITTGRIQVSGTSGGAYSGDPYTFRPDSITGWYKYAPVGIDTGYAEVILVNSDDTDTIGRGKFFQTGTVANWTRFSAKIDYFSAEVPSLLRIILNSSSGFDPQAGSVIYFDDLDFAFVTGINENEEKLNFRVSPNPATEELFIKNPFNETAKMLIFDITGKKVNEINIGLNTTRTNIATYSPGVYLYSFVNKNSEILYKGKLVITR